MNQAHSVPASTDSILSVTPWPGCQQGHVEGTREGEERLGQRQLIKPICN